MHICISTLQRLDAQVSTAMSPEANAFYINAMPAIGQQIKNLVLQTAGAIKHYKVNTDSLSRKLHSNKILKDLSNNDIDGITVLIMVQASKDADADLKLMVLGMNRRNEQKGQQEATIQTVSENNTDNKPRSIEEIRDMQNAKLRMIMERKSRMAEEINDLMKKISGTQQNIIADLK